MFVKSYKYRIKKQDFNKWKRINNAARKIYSDYGGGNSKILIKKEKNFITILEFDYYQSKKDFLEINKQVNRNQKINMLFKEFIKIVHQNKISKEEFETI